MPLARFGRERDIEIRYIEFMPLDSQGLWERVSVLLADHYDRHAGARNRGVGSDSRSHPEGLRATEYRFTDGIGRVGFIASVSRPFCLNCNRLRTWPDGQLRYCLFAVEETDSLRSDSTVTRPMRKFVAAVGAGTREMDWLRGSIPRASSRRRPMYSIADEIPGKIKRRGVKHSPHVLFSLALAGIPCTGKLRSWRQIRRAASIRNFFRSRWNAGSITMKRKIPIIATFRSARTTKAKRLTRRLKAIAGR